MRDNRRTEKLEQLRQLPAEKLHWLWEHCVSRMEKRAWASQGITEANALDEIPALADVYWRELNRPDFAQRYLAGRVEVQQ